MSGSLPHQKSDIDGTRWQAHTRTGHDSAGHVRAEDAQMCRDRHGPVTEDGPDVERLPHTESDIARRGPATDGRGRYCRPRDGDRALSTLRARLADAHATPHRRWRQIGTPRWSTAMPLRRPGLPRTRCTLTTSDAAVVLAALRPTVEQPRNEPEQSSSEREVRCAEDDQDPSIHRPSLPRLAGMSRHGIVTVRGDATRSAKEPYSRRPMRHLPALRLRPPLPGGRHPSGRRRVP